MGLFDKVPQDFFSILTSTNKVLYVDALMLLLRKVKHGRMLDKGEYLEDLKDKLENRLIEADFSEEENDEANRMEHLEKEGISGKARMILRRLEETQWIEIEQVRNTFDEIITIPDYAMVMLNALKELSSDKAREYNKYVYPTYSLLKHYDEHPEYLYQTLVSVYENTSNLEDQLISLQHNIRRYFQGIFDQMDVNELLHQHFDLYHNKIVAAMLTPIMTIDSVSKFRNSIMAVLEEWALDEDILGTLVEQGIQRQVYSDELEARADVLEKINYVIERYENLPGFISQIVQKHNEYTTTSIERIRYMTNTDKSLRGNLIKVLSASNEDYVYESLSDMIPVYRSSIADSDSLYNRVEQSRKDETEPLGVESEDTAGIDMDEFLEAMKSLYGDSDIDAFVLKHMEGRDTSDTSAFHIESVEDYVLFMLSTIRGRVKSAPYAADISSDAHIVSGRFRLPLVTYTLKKEESDV